MYSERFYGTQKLGNSQKLWEHAREHGSQPERILTLYSETKWVITATSDNDKLVPMCSHRKSKHLSCQMSAG